MTDTERKEILKEAVRLLSPQYRSYDEGTRLLFDKLVVSVDAETDENNFELIKENLINDITVQMRRPEVDRLEWIVNHINENIRNGRSAF